MMLDYEDGQMQLQGAKYNIPFYNEYNIICGLVKEYAGIVHEII